MRSPNRALVLLNTLIFVCQMETLVSLLAECCITVYDAGQILKQHWIDVSRLLELQLLF